MQSSFSGTGLDKWGPGAGAALERLSGAGEALIARTMAWSDINSGSYEPEGLARMLTEIERAFAVLSGKVELQRLASTQRVRADGGETDIEHGAALRVRVRPDAPIQIALTGHYDTVFPAAHPFQKSWREGDRIRGPGVADMKGGLAVMLAALDAFESTPGEKRIGYEVLLSPDEEIGSPASAPLLAELGARAHVGMVYEPAQADGAMVDARKGSGNFALIFTGKGAHVGRAFSDGRNAIIAAARVAEQLHALNGARDGLTLNVAAIDGGAPLNSVPHNAVLRFNLRAPDPDSAHWGLARIEEIAAKADGAGDVRARLTGGVTRPPKPLNAAQRALAGWVKSAAAQLQSEIGFSASGGVCEGNNLAAAGCPNIDTFGPCGGGLHTDQEFALASSFAERAQLSFLMLAGLQSGAFDVRSLRA